MDASGYIRPIGEKYLVGSLYCSKCEEKEYAIYVINGNSVCEKHRYTDMKESK
jgi:hypothetical protein